jgi:addiction module RelE/StbE family toxin
MKWKIISTETFSKEFKKYKKDNEFLKALDNKIKRLQQEPHNVGGYLSGNLHGYKSTRIIRKLRLIFKILDENKEVYLSAIDHRKFDYKKFSFD